MKAVVIHDFGGPEVLSLEEVQDLKPGPGEVLIEVKAVGANPVETYQRAGSPYFDCCRGKSGGHTPGNPEKASPCPSG